MTASHLREGDADLLVQVLDDARHDDSGEPVPWALLDGLQRLVPCDMAVSYQHHDYQVHHTRVMEFVDDDHARGVQHPPPGRADEPFWATWWQSGCSWPQRTGDLRSIIHTGDFFPTERARRNDPLRWVLPDLRSCMILSLPAAPGHARRVLFQRSTTPDFTERDRQVAALLRPHVQEILVDAERRRNGVPRLTVREWEVLALAGAGLPYADIARTLFVSLATVRKHMEHVRERLGVHSVAEAAALALPHAPPALGGGPPPQGGH